MEQKKYCIHLRPAGMCELSAMPKSEDINLGLGNDMHPSVSDLFPVGYIVKPVSLNCPDPSALSPVSAPSFKKLKKAKYISKALFKLIYRLPEDEAAALLTARLDEGKAFLSGSFLYDHTECEPADLTFLNTRLESPFVLRFTENDSFWFFICTDEITITKILEKGHVYICKKDFLITKASSFTDGGCRCLLTADMRIVPGSIINQNSKSLFRLFSDGSYHYICSGAVMDPTDKLSCDNSYIDPFILNY